MKKLIVLGAGESGVGAAILGKEKGYNVFVSDSGKIQTRYKQELESHSIAWEEGTHTLSMFEDADLVVKSPGIPDSLPMILLFKKASIPVISEIEFAGRYSNAKMICITGSNGKTTTTMLIYHLLKCAGLKVGSGIRSFSYQYYFNNLNRPFKRPPATLLSSFFLADFFLVLFFLPESFEDVPVKSSTKSTFSRSAPINVSTPALLLSSSSACCPKRLISNGAAAARIRQRERRYMAEPTLVPSSTGSRWAFTSSRVVREQISLFTMTASSLSGSEQILWARSMARIPASVWMEVPSENVNVIVFIDTV